jgi:hypothetical protein
LLWFGEIERKFAKLFKDCCYLPFFLLIILCLHPFLRVHKLAPIFTRQLAAEMLLLLLLLQLLWAGSSGAAAAAAQGPACQQMKLIRYLFFYPYFNILLKRPAISDK